MALHVKVMAQHLRGDLPVQLLLEVLQPGDRTARAIFSRLHGGTKDAIVIVALTGSASRAGTWRSPC